VTPEEDGNDEQQREHAGETPESDLTRSRCTAVRTQLVGRWREGPFGHAPKGFRVVVREKCCGSLSMLARHAELHAADCLGVQPVRANQILVEHDGRDAVGDKVGARDVRLGSVKKGGDADLIDPLRFNDVPGRLAWSEGLAALGTSLDLVEELASPPEALEIGARVVGAVLHPAFSRGLTDRGSAAAARTPP
jgi:hypothetical protein